MTTTGTEMTDTLQAFVRDAALVRIVTTALAGTPSMNTHPLDPTRPLHCARCRDRAALAIIQDREAQLAEKDATHREREARIGEVWREKMRHVETSLRDERDALQSRLTQAEAAIAAVRQLADGFEWMGCFTGDCPDSHRANDCVAAMIAVRTEFLGELRALVGAAPTLLASDAWVEKAREWLATVGYCPPPCPRGTCDEDPGVHDDRCCICTCGREALLRDIEPPHGTGGRDDG
jgi:hypothetical protein